MVEKVHAPRTDLIGDLARDHRVGEQGEPRATRMGQLLQRWQPSARRYRALDSYATAVRVAPVVALQAQGQGDAGGGS